MKLYLDNCCFNRPYDDQSSIRNRLETEAKLYIQAHILKGKYQLIWSYILDFENSQNPFVDRKKEMAKWKDFAKDLIIESESVIVKAENFVELNIKPKDALHLACAIAGDAKYFLTTDNKLLNKDNLVEEIEIISPIRFVEIEED